MDDLERIPEVALDWHREGRGPVLATVAETWGSAPRGVGSQLVVSAAGEMEGSVSGGCVEGAVVMEAMEMGPVSPGKMLEFGVSDEEAFAVGLGCGGRIKVWVEPVAAMAAELEEIVMVRDWRAAVEYRVNTVTGARTVVRGGFGVPFVSRQSGMEGDEFVHLYNPTDRIVIVGAVHIAQALVPMAQLAGYEVVIIDPRPVFGSQARFPGVRIMEDWPDEAFDELGTDGMTFVVTLTHDPKLDDPAIKVAIRSDVYYVGCLGSKRTHAKRVERLREAGFTDTEIARIHGPVGLSIGARGPAEIAISIMAEITQVRSTPPVVVQDAS